MEGRREGEVQPPHTHLPDVGRLPTHVGSCDYLEHVFTWKMEEQLLFPFPHTLQTCELTSDQVDIIGNEGNIVLHLQTGVSGTLQNNVPNSWG